jgi:hypothetical protein
MRATCQSTKRNGDPCGATAVLSSGFCTAHDPAYREQRAAQSAKGGRHKSNAERAAKSLPEDLKDVGAMLLQAMHDVRDGRLDTKIASSLASLANAYRGIFEVGTIDAKLAEIEARLAAAESDGK